MSLESLELTLLYILVFGLNNFMQLMIKVLRKGKENLRHMFSGAQENAQRPPIAKISCGTIPGVYARS